MNAARLASSAREDVIVSVCLPSFSRDLETSDDVARDHLVDELAGLRQALVRAYRFVEIVVVADPSCIALVKQALDRRVEARVVVTREGVDLYGRRAVALLEAIGDVVCATEIGDTDAGDLLAMIATAIDDRRIVFSHTRGRVRFARPISALGRIAGFRVEPGVGRTGVYPRSLLDRLIAHPDPVLALRFAPTGRSFPVLRVAASRRRGRGGSEALFGRLVLARRLLTSASPGLLAGLAGLGAATMFVGLGVALYAVGALTFSAELAAGWFTTMTAMAGLIGVSGAILFGLSLGVLRILEILSGGAVPDWVDETTTTPLFEAMRRKANVEIEKSGDSAADTHDAEDVA